MGEWKLLPKTKFARKFLLGLAVSLSFGASAHPTVAAPTPPPPSDTTDPVCGNWTFNGEAVSGEAWTNSAPQSFTLSNSTDAGSGIEDDGGTCSASANFTCTEQIKDKAGNTRNCTSPVLRLDNSAPSCGTWSPGANPSAWSMAASITFSLNGSSDGWSGLKSGIATTCAASNHLQTCVVTLEDKAGNTRNCTSPTARFDRTPPVCSAWQMNNYPKNPSSTYSTWNGAYDIVSIPFTSDGKLIYAQGNDPSGISGEGQSGIAGSNEFHCDVEDPATSSVDMCQAVVRDNAGNATICGRWGSTNGPRSRIDLTPPPQPGVSCSLIDANNSRYRCEISPSTITGPAPAMMYWSRSKSATSGFGDWILIGPVWYQLNTATAAMEMQGTENLQFELNITTGTTEYVRVRAVEMPDTPHARENTSVTVEIVAPYVPAPSPPVTGTPAPATDGTQTLTYGPDTNDWYTQWCPGALYWPSLPEGDGTPSQSSVTRCSGDGDGKGYPSIMGGAGNGGSAACMCFDNNPPIIGTATVNHASWTKEPINISAGVSNPNQNEAPFLGWTASCPGGGGSWAGASISFSCGGNSPSQQIATIRACDAASQCTTRTVPYYRETEAPTGAAISILGWVHNHSGHSSASDTQSSDFTFTPIVNVAITSPSDSGGSGLKTNPLQISCSPTPNDAADWISSPPATFNITTGYGCNASEGTKTVYLHVRDNAGNITTAASNPIKYDVTKPTFSYLSNVVLKARENYTYVIQSPADTGGSDIRDYTITWVENESTVEGKFDSTDNAFTKDFGTRARNLDSDGIRSGKIVVSIEDNAGNWQDHTMNFVLISAEVDFAKSSVTRTASDTPMVGDLSDEYLYNIRLADNLGNPVFPISWFRHIRTDWEIDNQSSFLGTSSFTDGAIEYDWNGYGYVANDVPDYNSFRGVETTGDEFYFFKVRAAVPTVHGYQGNPKGYPTQNTIRPKRIHFENAIACPSGYTCVGPNVNDSYGSNLGDDLVSKTSEYLAFKAPIEVEISKLSSNGEEWMTLTDGSWHPMQVKFVNNSNTETFRTDRYKLTFRFTSELGPFADLRIRPGSGTGLGTASVLSAQTDKSLPLTFGASFLPALGPSARETRNVEFQANSYGYGFGKFGFTAFLPYSKGDSAKNRIEFSSGDKRTGFNTYNLGIDKQIFGFEQENLSTPVPADKFWAETAAGQTVAIIGSLADKGKNALKATAKDAVAIDTATTDRRAIKTNFRKNVVDMVRNIAPRNSSTDCSPTLPTTLSESLYFYDFRKQEENGASAINGNNGCTLRISGPAVTEGSGYKKLEVSGVKTIIVMGGNVNIDTNIAYANGKSMLAIVVLRDDTVRTKGGNIYVNPRVTNINAGAYAEGSLMSVQGTTAYDIDNTKEGDLTKQLLWYGSLYSANTIGGAVRVNNNWECPFGSDAYEKTKSKNCSQAEASKYDFIFLRRFVLLDASTGTCAGKRTAKRIGTSYEEYAIAGEKQCFEDALPKVPKLRTTQKTTPFVAEYNPFIQSSGAQVFSVSK